MKDIYTMELHETLQVSDSLFILRVAGGWIYRERYVNPYDMNARVAINTFVPFNNEFQI